MEILFMHFDENQNRFFMWRKIKVGVIQKTQYLVQDVYI